MGLFQMLIENVPGRSLRVSLGRFSEISGCSFQYNPEEKAHTLDVLRNGETVRISRSPGTPHPLLKFSQKPKSRTSESAKTPAFEASF